MGWRAALEMSRSHEVARLEEHRSFTRLTTTNLAPTGFDAVSAGLRWPAEFERHTRTWMAWPVRRALWGEHLESVCADYGRLARAISQFEPVVMVANPGDGAAAQAECGANVMVVEIPIDDSWTRDSGPTFIVGARQERKAVTWRFNGWGESFVPFDKDARLASRIAEAAAVPVVASQLVVEGGAIVTDGEGTLVTTESCLLSPRRNGDLRKVEVEAELKRMLGVSKVIWLPGDPSEAETDGHIDGIMAFARPGVVVLESSSDRTHDRYEVLRENRRALELARDAAGRSIAIVPIPSANDAVPVGNRYCRSYVNFYIANGAVIAPAYGISSDDDIASLLQEVFPTRRVVMLPIGCIAVGGGGFHCVTQQEPAPP